MIRKKKTARRTSKSAKFPAKRKTARGAPPAPRRASKLKGAPKRTTRPARAERAERTERTDTRPVVPAVAPVLSPKRRRQLRGDAHGLEPIVHVGHGGLSEAVVQAVSRALLDHELIKVRLHEPEDKQGMAAELATATHAALCGLVGHTVILYREKPKQKGVSGVARSAIKRNREKRGRR